LRAEELETDKRKTILERALITNPTARRQDRDFSIIEVASESSVNETPD
jgi:hypothetical protein